MDDAGRNQFAVTNGLVVLVVVGCIGLLQFLPKFDEKPRYVLPKFRIGILAEEVLDNAVVVGDDLVQGFHTEVAVVFAEVGQNLL